MVFEFKDRIRIQASSVFFLLLMKLSLVFFRRFLLDLLDSACVLYLSRQIKTKLAIIKGILWAESDEYTAETRTVKTNIRETTTHLDTI